MNRWADEALAILMEEARDPARSPCADIAKSVENPFVPPEIEVSTIATISTPDDSGVERASIIESDSGVPSEWAEGLARVLSSPPLPGVAAVTWLAMIDRAARFCDRWAAIAAAEGWTAAELFGLDPASPLGRLDRRGAAFIGRDLEVIEITRKQIVFRTSGGAVQRLGRRLGLAAPVWEGFAN